MLPANGLGWIFVTGARTFSMGAHVEDTVLVTENGGELLTDAAPTDPDAIEALMATGAHD
jgi:Xaa-Pro aminopeptidase